MALSHPSLCTLPKAFPPPPPPNDTDKARTPMECDLFSVLTRLSKESEVKVHLRRKQTHLNLLLSVDVSPLAGVLFYGFTVFCCMVHLGPHVFFVGCSPVQKSINAQLCEARNTGSTNCSQGLLGATRYHSAPHYLEGYLL